MENIKCPVCGCRSVMIVNGERKCLRCYSEKEKARLEKLLKDIEEKESNKVIIVNMKQSGSDCKFIGHVDTLNM